MSRQKVLNAIAAALDLHRGDQAPRREAVAQRLATPPCEVSLDRLKRRSGSLQCFCTHLAEKGVDVAPVADRELIPATVVRYLDTLGLVRMIRSAEGIAEPHVWAAAGMKCSDGSEAANDHVAISRASAGIAESGTLVLRDDPGNPGLLALLPDTHIVVLDTRLVVPTIEEAFNLAREADPAGALPRALLLVSGASRTGDIGGRIVLGAHGPRRLCVMLVGEGLPNTKEDAIEAPSSILPR